MARPAPHPLLEEQNRILRRAHPIGAFRTLSHWNDEFENESRWRNPPPVQVDGHGAHGIRVRFPAGEHRWVSYAFLRSGAIALGHLPPRSRVFKRWMVLPTRVRPLARVMVHAMVYEELHTLTAESASADKEDRDAT
jgi:hypothetical protein